MQMNAFPSTVVVLISFVFLRGCDAGCEHTGTTLQLTEKNWNDEVVLGDKLLHFVEFSAPWCIWSPSHECDDMIEAWKELGKEYDDHDIVQIGEVDCGRFPGIDENSYSIKSPCQLHFIREYPTVRAFNPALGPHGANYSGAASIEGLRSFVNETVSRLCLLTGDALEPNSACSAKEVSFAEQWRAKPMSEVEAELARMRGVFAKATEDRTKDISLLVSWMGMRINLLQQLVVAAKKNGAPLKVEL